MDAEITAEKHPGGPKHEQHPTDGTPVWHQVYGLRNSVESVNRNYTRSQFEYLQNAGRGHVRGNRFTYVGDAVRQVRENTSVIEHHNDLNGAYGTGKALRHVGEPLSPSRCCRR
jgi:hypothetical protein